VTDLTKHIATAEIADKLAEKHRSDGVSTMDMIVPADAVDNYSLVINHVGMHVVVVHVHLEPAGVSVAVSTHLPDGQPGRLMTPASPVPGAVLVALKA
jgi:hypothetical protein